MKLSEIPRKSEWIGCQVRISKSPTTMRGNNEFEGVVLDFRKRVLVAFPQARHSHPQWFEPEKVEVLRFPDGSVP